jgi:hypothetical protein
MDEALEQSKKEYPNIIFKRHDNLVIFKYLQKYGDEIERSCRGLILDTIKKKIVCQSNVGTLDLETFMKHVPFGKCVIEENLEGTLVNLYYHEGSWKVSTKFSINADSSRFRSKKTFRQQFDYVFKGDLKKLDINFTYTFLLRIPENRLVSKIKKRRLYHIETQNNITGDKLLVQLGIPHLTIYKLNDKNTLEVRSYNKLSALLNSIPWSIRGYMLYSSDRKYRCSLINPNYTAVKKLVENQSDVRYIALDSLFYKKNMNDILRYFPEYSETFKNVDNDIKTLVKNLYKVYLNIHVYGKTDSPNNKYKKIINLIHMDYKQNKRNNLVYRVNKDTVIKVLLEQSCPYVFSLLYKHS